MYQKNHGFLMDVFHEVALRSKNTFLISIGDGELRSEIEAKARAMGLESRIRFLGLRKDVQSLYNAMDVFVLPSWYEGLPVVSIEAQANGLRCVFSDRVTKESGLTRNTEFYSLEEGASAWAEKILKLSTERNAKAKEDMAASGFDIHVQASKLLSWYMTFS